MCFGGGELLLDELQLRGNQLYRQDRKRKEERQRIYGRMQAVKAESGRNDGGIDDMPEEVAVQAEFYMEVPAQLAGRCDIHQYNMLMRNEPHTRFIARFFPGAVPEWLIRVFEVIDHNYRLQGSVINVLIHYVLGYERFAARHEDVYRRRGVQHARERHRFLRKGRWLRQGTGEAGRGQGTPPGKRRRGVRGAEKERRRGRFGSEGQA